MALSGSMSYTKRHMQQFLNNRYVRLSLLTLGLGTLFYLIIWLIVGLLGMNDFPHAFIFLLSGLGAGLLVYKVFASRVF